MPTPRVSFLLPVYNGERYLAAALASLRWQTFTDWEAVCVDDGSTDSTPEVLARFAAVDPRIRVVRQPNGGLVEALNRGLAETRSGWIARMDADDLATPDRLERQLAIAESDPNTVLVGGAVVTIDPDGDPLRVERFPATHEPIESGLLAGVHVIAHPTVLMQREAVQRVGSYRQQYEAVQDIDLWHRLARAGQFANAPDPVLFYRQHEASFCRTRSQAIREQYVELVKEMHQERGLPLSPARLAELAKPVRRTPLIGKWARQAARNGRVGVALKLLSQQWREAPLSSYTARVAAEVVLRSMLSLASGRREEIPDMPDWWAWDCQAASSRAA